MNCMTSNDKVMLLGSPSLTFNPEPLHLPEAVIGAYTSFDDPLRPEGGRIRRTLRFKHDNSGSDGRLHIKSGMISIMYVSRIVSWTVYYS